MKTRKQLLNELKEQSESLQILSILAGGAYIVLSIPFAELFDVRCIIGVTVLLVWLYCLIGIIRISYIRHKRLNVPMLDME